MADQESVSRHPQWARWVWRVAGGALVLGLLLLLVWPGAQWWVEHIDGVKIHGQGGLAGKDRQAALDNARGRITGIATGLLAAIAIYYTATNAASARSTARAAQDTAETARRSAEIAEAAQLRTFELTQEGQRLSEEAQRRTFELTEEGQRRTHELTERGQLTDRFTAAVAQLGDPAPAIQLGGVHALAGLADDAPTSTLRQTCIDVLCAYLRLPYDPDPGEESTSDRSADIDAHFAASKTYRALREVRHTIIRLVGNHLRDDSPISWQGHNFDFTDVVFDGGDLHDAIFSGGTVTFSGARFPAGTVNFGGAVFSGGTVDFENTHFSGGDVTFPGARFSGSDVTFENARFSGGTITFANAVFSGSTVTFDFAGFSGGTVLFTGAVFSDGAVIFDPADFSGGTVDFEFTEFSGGTVDLRQAVGKFQQGIRLPEGEAYPDGLLLPEAWYDSA